MGVPESTSVCLLKEGTSERKVSSAPIVQLGKPRPETRGQDSSVLLALPSPFQRPFRPVFLFSTRGHDVGRTVSEAGTPSPFRATS